MGSVTSHTVDTEKLSESKATELKDLLTQSDFFKLSSMRSNHTPPVFSCNSAIFFCKSFSS
jgi:hypothetical protein